MKIRIVAFLFLLPCLGLAQQGDDSKNTSVLKELAESACKCADSVETRNRPKPQVQQDLAKCIDNYAGAYQLMAKTTEATSGKNKKKKNVTISIDFDKESPQYKEYYYEMERYLMDNCEPMKRKMLTNNQETESSFSTNEEAIDLYNKGLKESEKKNYKQAIEYYESALKIDAKFAFAWDNLGLAYRNLGYLDKALEAYNKSLEIDPNGQMPLQNSAVVYTYMKDYPKAIAAYERLVALDPNNPETFYGIGLIYTSFMPDHEKALVNMCKAYNIYVEQRSPFRTDAEKIISMLHAEMKKAGKESKFNEILKDHKIQAQFSR